MYRDWFRSGLSANVSNLPVRSREIDDIPPNNEESGALPAVKNEQKNSSLPPKDTPKHMREMNDVQPNNEESDALPAAKNNEQKNNSPPPKDSLKYTSREMNDVQPTNKESGALPAPKNNEQNSSPPSEDTPKHMSREMNDVHPNNEESGTLLPPRNNKRKNRSSPPEDTPKRMRFPDVNDSESTSLAVAPCVGRDSADEIVDRPEDPFTSLPPEIILHILNYLPLCDRRPIRLTCRILNECSKHVSFTRKEKFVFPVGRNRLANSRINEILLQTNSSSLNLEFRGAHTYMHGLSADVWRTCGDRVLSLSFHNCLPAIPILEDIFCCCNNLEVIEFGECFPAIREFPIGHEFEQAFDHLIELEVECTHLHTLMMFHLEEVHSSLVKKIFIVFPNLKHLHGSFIDTELTTECVKPFVQLRSLNYHVVKPEPVSWLKFGITPELPIRLTEFRTHLEKSNLDSESTESSLFRFVKSQDQLEIFSLSMPQQEFADSTDAEWKKELMFHVLRSCRKLREFCFSLPCSASLDTTDEMAEFLDLISRLKCLKLSYLPRIRSIVPLPSVCTELALDTLQVTISSGSNKLLLHISKHCPKMQHLFINEEPNMYILTEIFRSMPELRTLAIRAVMRHFRSRGSSNIDCYDVEGLQNLEYLEVHAHRFEELPLKELQKIQFRRMKHVRLGVRPVSRICKEKIFPELRKILWNMPAVETVELPGLHLYFGSTLVTIFKDLKNLRRLAVHRREHSYHFETMFRARPTLKFLSVLSVQSRRSYLFDSSTDRMVSQDLHTVEEQGASCRNFLDL